VLVPFLEHLVFFSPKLHTSVCEFKCSHAHTCIHPLHDYTQERRGRGVGERGDGRTRGLEAAPSRPCWPEEWMRWKPEVEAEQRHRPSRARKKVEGRRRIGRDRIGDCGRRLARVSQRVWTVLYHAVKKVNGQDSLPGTILGLRGANLCEASVGGASYIPLGCIIQ
jgi:hypothetical protein